MKLYRGICVGGPLDGREVTKMVEHFQEPVLPNDNSPASLTTEPPYSPMPINMRRAFYDWNEEERRFIFQGYDL